MFLLVLATDKFRVLLGHLLSDSGLKSQRELQGFHENGDINTIDSSLKCFGKMYPCDRAELVN